MQNDFRKILYSSLLAVFLIISNLVGIKYTEYHGLILSVNFITIPFIFLCFLLIRTMYGRKSSINALISSILVQIIIMFMYFLITSFTSQNIIPDLSHSVNLIFKVNIWYIIINLLVISLCNLVMDYIYEYFKIIGYRFLGSIISFLSAFILYDIISIPLTNSSLQFDLIIHLILCHIIMSVFMSLLITCLFYILKEREYPFYENKIFINDIKELPKNSPKDKSIDEIIKIEEKKEKKEEKKKTKSKTKRKEKRVNKSKSTVNK